MQRTKPSERGVLQVEVQLRPEQLAGDEQSCAEADKTPNDSGDGEGADDAVVVFECFNVHGFSISWFVGKLFLARWADGSSTKIRIDGVWVSSYWPERTAQMK